MNPVGDTIRENGFFSEVDHLGVVENLKSEYHPKLLAICNAGIFFSAKLWGIDHDNRKLLSIYRDIEEANKWLLYVSKNHIHLMAEELLKAAIDAESLVEKLEGRLQYGKR